MAGRTDAGVHARGQVASFKTGSRLRARTFVRALNALLPRDIGVKAAQEVALTFDPRRDAFRRLYRYTIYVGAERPVLDRAFVWHVGPGVDLNAIGRAARTLVGRHDLAAFTAPSIARNVSTEREVFRAELTQNGAKAWLDIEANAFLQHMVRRIAGALVQVGAGKRDAREFEILLRHAEPGAARYTAPPQGLCLIKVRYESGLFDAEADDDIPP
jgi:tRNA pseudouridine38-40 synthase